MKKIVLIFVFMIVCNINAQVQNRCSPSITSFADFQSGVHYKDLSNYFAPFLGTWKNVTGNKTFKVILFKVEDVDYLEGYYLDEIQGRFEMIENEGQPNEVVLYKSHRFMGNSTVYYPSVIQGTSCNGIGLGGWITDNSKDGYKSLDGRLSININPNINPPTAHWKVTKLGQSIIVDAMIMTDFQIPTDLVLTKQ